jgi:hypothetical protein
MSDLTQDLVRDNQRISNDLARVKSLMVIPNYDCIAGVFTTASITSTGGKSVTIAHGLSSITGCVPMASFGNYSAVASTHRDLRAYLDATKLNIVWSCDMYTSAQSLTLNYMILVPIP